MHLVVFSLRDFLKNIEVDLASDAETWNGSGSENEGSLSPECKQLLCRFLETL